MELDLRLVPTDGLNRNDFILFAESNSRFLVEVPENCEKDFEAVMRGCTFARIGKVTTAPRLCVYGLDGNVVVDAPISELLSWWKRTLSGSGGEA
jgi:phosphoribosylformylglycinamidine synthase